MGLKFKLILLPATLLLCGLVGAAQEQQSPPNESQPQASSPSQPAPKDTAPQTTGPQPGASNPAAPESPAGKDQTPQEQPPQEQPPANAQTPASPNEQSPGAQKKPPSTSTSKTSGAVRKKSAKASPGHAHPATRRHKPVTDPSGKVVVRNGGASDASIQLSPAGNQQESQDRKNTDQLLARADDNLKQVAGQQLTATQQSTVDQIRTYMRQAKSAADAGDLARAHTLALKAHLLSVDLTRH